MPIIVEATLADGTTEVIRVPAEIWRRDEKSVTKVFIFSQEATSFRLDPFLETADVELNNNSFPPVAQPSKYDFYKEKQSRENPMQRDKREKELEKGN